ncbi:MAG: DUF1122 family protein [Candidatus Bathyarchaeia archaeon]
MFERLKSIESRRLGPFEIKLEVRPRKFVEQMFFTLALQESSQRGQAQAFSGIFSEGRSGICVRGWIDGDYFDELSFENSCIVLSDSDLAGKLFQMLGEAIPDGGSIMVAYEMFSQSHRVHTRTRYGLERGNPPIVTPLGYLLFRSGCMDFKNWYIPEGGNEGPPKLQGTKPISSDHRNRSRDSLVKELQRFVETEDIGQEEAKKTAQKVLSQLQHI